MGVIRRYSDIRNRPGRKGSLDLPRRRHLLAAVVVAMVCYLYLSAAHASTDIPTVFTVSITSDPGADKIYSTVDTITAGVNFSEAVSVEGSRRVTIDPGVRPRNAKYSPRGSAAKGILFDYKAVAGERDPGRVSVLVNSLNMNGGIIEAADDFTPATLMHTAMTFDNHPVNPAASGTKQEAGRSSSPRSDQLTGGVCDRTEQVKVGLVAAAGVGDCSLVTDALLAGITLLNLNDKEITQLQASDFEGLTSLRWLYLEDNELTLDSFPEGMFSSLPNSIRNLTFRGNPGCPTHGNSCFPPTAALKVGSGAPEDLMARTDESVVISRVPEDFHDPLGRSLAYSFTQESGPTAGLVALRKANEWFLVAPHVGADETAAFTLSITPAKHTEVRWSRAILSDLWQEATATATLTFSPPPVSSDTTLSALAIDGISPDYDTSEGRYEITVINSVVQVAVHALASDGNARVVIHPGDVALQRTGHQVALNPGTNDITVTVTASDGVTSQIHNVTVTREETGGVCNRTQQVMDALLAAVGVEDCAMVTAANLAEIVLFNLTDKGISTLQAHDFAGLTELRYLYLADNNLTLDSFPGGMFNSLPPGFDTLTFSGNPGCPTHGSNCFPPVPTLKVGEDTPGDLVVRTGDPVALSSVPDSYRDPLGRSLRQGLTQDSGTAVNLVGSKPVGRWYFFVPRVSADEDAAFSLSITPATHSNSRWSRATIDNLWKQATGSADLRFLAPRVPEAPGMLRSEPGAAGTLTLSWNTSPDGGSAIIKYQYRQKSETVSFGDWTDIPGSGPDTTSHTVSSLGYGTHTFQVRAVNLIGEGDPSTEISADNFPEVTVQYGQASYKLAEGETVNVIIVLSEAPRQTTVVPITTVGQGGATSADYTAPTSVTFNRNESRKAIAFMAVEDDEDDDDKIVKLGFGADLPDNVALGTTREATFAITDDRDLTATVVEPPNRDLPFSGETWGYVDTGGPSTGTLDVTYDSGHRTGDMWKLRLDPYRRYRVQVSFGDQIGVNRGGSIGVNDRGDLWDHMRDDGLAFVEFTAKSESYHLDVLAEDSLNQGALEYYGRYTVQLLDITGTNLMVSNGDAYSGSKIEVPPGYLRATSFTTGPNPGGYRLSYVGTGLHSMSGAPRVKAGLYTDSAGAPGTKIFDFERVEEITGHPTAQRSDRFWAPPSALNLAASTAYWVVFKEVGSRNGTYQITRTDSGTDNPGAASGWSIGDTIQSHFLDTWSTLQSDSSILLEIYASNVEAASASEAADRMAPQFRSAAVDRSILTLGYDETLDSVAVPNSAFAVNVNGSPCSVLAVAVGQSNVILLLSPAVVAGDTVTVAYAVPADEGAARVQDPSGNAAKSFTGREVTNNTVLPLDITTRPADSGGLGKLMEAVVNLTAPEPPHNLMLELHGSGKLASSWEAPESGTTPEGYTVQWKESGSDWADPSGVSIVSVTTTSRVITGLTDGTEYSIRVIATRDDAQSEPSEEVTATPAAAPLSASAHDVPASHDGNSSFTFELRFSETPKRGFSYETLQDHALRVTGGEVVKARRLERRKDVRWEISVTPAGDGPVTILLAATTDCDADSAVCTEDGRRLSQGPEFEVPGPSAPEITTGSPLRVEEGATEVATLGATDGDTPAAHLSWSISGGDDEAQFTVTRAGVLSFAEAEDYESPDDANTDRAYEVTVEVSDGGRADTAHLTVTLTNVNEAPRADAGFDRVNVAQGDTVSLDGSGTDPDRGEVLSYAWTQTSGAAVTLSDTSVASPTFQAPTGLEGDAALTFTLRVTDDEGLFEEDSVTVTIIDQPEITPFTASTHEVPGSHDGISTFTFELRFSETPKRGFSYETLQDHAFTVTGGEVVKARRLEKRRDVRWEISVTPAGDGPVTILLPATTDCDADGAICTEDGRKLSRGLEFEVSGLGTP